MADLRRQSSSSQNNTVPAVATGKDEMSRMRAELARLRDRNAQLEEKLADVLDDEGAELAAAS